MQKQPVSFFTRGTGRNSHAAFEVARQRVRENLGHVDLGSKERFTMILREPSVDGVQLAQGLLEQLDRRCSDPQGPCGCINMGGPEYLFFGRF